jgi:hypothetical protein
MIDPKTFYRDFDILLKKIRHERKHKNFIFSILKEVQVSFGASLKFGNLRIYEERGDEFVLVHTFLKKNGRPLVRSLSLHSEPVQQVLQNGSYIYDADLSIDPDSRNHGYYAVPAALVIKGPERRWIVLFELKEGWIREEILFSLNAVRTALNYRLFSEAIQNELQQAALIQQSLLPSQPPEIPGYQMAARSQTTEIVGGDLFDFFEFGEDNFGVCIGDASGHGLPAALLVRDVVIGLRMGLEKNMKMVYTFQRLNNVIYRSTYSSRFVSLFYGEIESDGHLICVNAGHPAPFVVHEDQVTELKATGLILGALPEITLHRSYAQVKPNSVLVMFSDGIFERENKQEEAYSIKRLKKLVMKCQKLSAKQILDNIFDDVYEFGNRDKWEDDSTVIVIKRL